MTQALALSIPDFNQQIIQKNASGLEWEQSSVKMAILHVILVQHSVQNC